MTQSLAQNAIAMLIDLAERGEIDPWDVKVIEVIDRFLSQLQPAQQVLQPAEAGRAPYEANLSESGQAFLYASMLVLLKADSLARLDVEEEEPDLLQTELFFEDGAVDRPLPPHLERQIRRRAVARPIQNRRVTLPELISQLEFIAAAMAERQPRKRTRRPRPQSRSQAVRTIAQLAHDENLSELATTLEQLLGDRWQAVGEAEEWLDFEILLDLWTTLQNNSKAQTAKPTNEPEHQSSPQGDRVGVFWALLFLSAQSKVELSQEEFYQDLKVKRFSPADASAVEEVSTFALPD